MGKYKLVIIFFLAIVLKSNGQNHLLLEGAIGSSPVVMLLGYDSLRGVDVTYFHKDKLHDVVLYQEGKNLWGSNRINAITEVDEDSSATSKPSLVLDRQVNSQNGEWKGVWKDGKGKSLPVSLNKLKNIDFQLNTNSNIDFTFINELIDDQKYIGQEPFLYQKARIACFKYVKDSVTMFGNYQLEWGHEMGSSIPMIQLKNGYPDTVLKKVNNILRVKQMIEATNFYACACRNKEGEYNFTLNQFFFSPEIISINAAINWYCYCAHPGWGDVNININALNGNELKDLDVFLNFTGKKPVLENDSNYYEYVETRGEAIVKIMTKLYPKEMAKPDSTNHDVCDYSRSYDWNFPEWYFKKEGLYLGPSFPHGMQACSGPEFAIIPYSLLKKYLNKKSPIRLPK